MICEFCNEKPPAMRDHISLAKWVTIQPDYTIQTRALSCNRAMANRKLIFSTFNTFTKISIHEIFIKTQIEKYVKSLSLL